MREILFKAKRIDNGEWVEGFYFEFKGKTYITEMRQTFMTTYYTEESVVDFNMRAYEVEAETICQYTGLTDKKGKKLWENDIVNCHEKRGAAFFRCVVLWNDVKARFDVKTTDCYFPMTLDGIEGDSAINGLDYETIGNIFDNTELLLTEI